MAGKVVGCQREFPLRPRFGPTPPRFPLVLGPTTAEIRRVLIAFNKPYGVLSQFTPDGSPNRPLAGFGFPPRVYALGRLDADSEGLLLLSDEPGLNHRLLARGVVLQDYKTRPCRVALLDPQPTVPPRDPPIRFRKNVPEAWIELELHEGKNRQVRRMTAAIGHPTLRLVRIRIGTFSLGDLPAGTWRELTPAERRQVVG